MVKSTFICFSSGGFGRHGMFSLIARLGSAHLRTGGSCKWNLRNVALQENILYCECQEEIPAMREHPCDAGRGSLPWGLQPTGSGRARRGGGLGAGLGWVWGGSGAIPRSRSACPTDSLLPALHLGEHKPPTSSREAGTRSDRAAGPGDG